MQIYYNDKIIGQIKDRTFYKTVDDNRHLMRIFGDTPGIQDTIDEHLDEFDNIEINTKKGKTFKVEKDKWLINRFHKDLGHGKQYFMDIKHWN
jgi:hypothetical protein